MRACLRYYCGEPLKYSSAAFSGMSTTCTITQVMLRRAVQDWEVAKAKQDKALDNIEKGIGTLKGIGEAMGESLKQQDVVLDTIDDKVRRIP